MVMDLRKTAPRWFNDSNPEEEARCIKFPAKSDYDPWFPEEDMEQTYSEAKNICLGTYSDSPCPLLAQCLEFALVNNERHGCWGGTTPEERIAIRRERRLQTLAKAGASPAVG